MKKLFFAIFAALFILSGCEKNNKSTVTLKLENTVRQTVFHTPKEDFQEVPERLQIGKPFIDFTLETSDGKTVNLAKTIQSNKVTLIDFWASYCNPCRKENRYVKAAYEKYHAKGLEIIGITLDYNKEKWLKAVEEDGLTWIQVQDINRRVREDYGVVFIPRNFLFNQNGVIIGYNLRGKELESKLKKVL